MRKRGGSDPLAPLEMKPIDGPPPASARSSTSLADVHEVDVELGEAGAGVQLQADRRRSSSMATSWSASVKKAGNRALRGSKSHAFAEAPALLTPASTDAGGSERRAYASPSVQAARAETEAAGKLALANGWTSQGRHSEAHSVLMNAHKTLKDAGVDAPITAFVFSALLQADFARIEQDTTGSGSTLMPDGSEDPARSLLVAQSALFEISQEAAVGAHVASAKKDTRQHIQAALFARRIVWSRENLIGGGVQDIFEDTDDRVVGLALRLCLVTISDIEAAEPTTATDSTEMTRVVDTCARLGLSAEDQEELRRFREAARGRRKYGRLFEGKTVETKQRVVKVFISSTFRDMNDEREHLVKFAFKQLRTIAAARRLSLCEVDLRTGVTEKQAKDAQVLAHCLMLIDDSDYFLCMLGQRYGWSQPGTALADRKHPDRDTPLDQTWATAVAKMPDELTEWLKEHDNRSVTEMEVRYAVLDKGRCRRAYFFLRDDSDRSVMPPYWTEDDPTRASRLASLKEEIATFCSTQSREGGAFREGREWHEQDDPNGLLVDAHYEHYTNTMKLQERAVSYIREALDLDFSGAMSSDTFESEWIAHAQLMSDLNRQFVADGPQQSVAGGLSFEKLDDFVRLSRKNRSKVACVVGEPGCGKSSLVAAWATQRHQKWANERIFLTVTHFVGGTPNSSRLEQVLRRIVLAIKTFGQLEGDVPETADGLKRTFGGWLEQAPTGTVIIIDALDRLEQDNAAWAMTWLPVASLKENVRVIVTTNPGPCFQGFMSVTKGCIEPKTDILRMGLLEKIPKGKIVSLFLEQYGKQLNPKQSGMVLNCPQTDNPLFLRLLLEEVRMYGCFEKLGDKISVLLQAQNVPEMFMALFNRVESDLAVVPGVRNSTRLVARALSLLWASRRGLSENELIVILGVQPRVWTLLHVSLKSLLVARGEELSFVYAQLRTSIEQRYLLNALHMQRAHEDLSMWFSCRRLDQRTVDELPWQVLYSNNLEALALLGVSMPLFSRMVRSDQGVLDLARMWETLCGHSGGGSIPLRQWREHSPLDFQPPQDDGFEMDADAAAGGAGRAAESTTKILFVPVFRFRCFWSVLEDASFWGQLSLLDTPQSQAQTQEDLYQRIALLQKLQALVDFLSEMDIRRDDDSVDVQPEDPEDLTESVHFGTRWLVLAFRLQLKIIEEYIQMQHHNQVGALLKLRMLHGRLRDDRAAATAFVGAAGTGFESNFNDHNDDDFVDDADGSKSPTSDSGAGATTSNSNGLGATMWSEHGLDDIDKELHVKGVKMSELLMPLRLKENTASSMSSYALKEHTAWGMSAYALKKTFLNTMGKFLDFIEARGHQTLVLALSEELVSVRNKQVYMHMYVHKVERRQVVQTSVPEEVTQTLLRHARLRHAVCSNRQDIERLQTWLHQAFGDVGDLSSQNHIEPEATAIFAALTIKRNKIERHANWIKYWNVRPTQRKATVLMRKAVGVMKTGGTDDLVCLRAMLQLADVLRQQGRFKEALEEYTKTLQQAIVSRKQLQKDGTRGDTQVAALPVTEDKQADAFAQIEFVASVRAARCQCDLGLQRDGFDALHKLRGSNALNPSNPEAASNLVKMAWLCEGLGIVELGLDLLRRAHMIVNSSQDMIPNAKQVLFNLGFTEAKLMVAAGNIQGGLYKAHECTHVYKGGAQDDRAFDEAVDMINRYRRGLRGKLAFCLIMSSAILFVNPSNCLFRDLNWSRGFLWSWLDGYWYPITNQQMDTVCYRTLTPALLLVCVTLLFAFFGLHRLYWKKFSLEQRTKNAWSSYAEIPRPSEPRLVIEYFLRRPHVTMMGLSVMAFMSTVIPALAMLRGILKLTWTSPGTYTNPAVFFLGIVNPSLLIALCSRLTINTDLRPKWVLLAVALHITQWCFFTWLLPLMYLGSVQLPPADAGAKEISGGLFDYVYERHGLDSAMLVPRWLCWSGPPIAWVFVLTKRIVIKDAVIPASHYPVE